MKSFRAIIIVIVSLITVGILYLIEQGINLSFFTQGLLKIVLLFLMPLACIFFFNRSSTKNWELRALKFKDVLSGFLIGGGSFFIIIAAYLILGRFVDITSIRSGLEGGLGVTANNFFIVGAYVIIVNSFLEEFFFRGVLFLHLSQHANRWFAYLFSAGLFAAYHITIIGGWFNPILMSLAFLSLFTIGLVFNYLNEKNGHILNSWIAHALADAAIIAVGAKVFGLF